MQPIPGQISAVPGQPTVVVQALPPPSQPVVVQSTSINCQAFGLGITQLILGILGIVFNVAAIALRSGPAYAACGIWCGILFVITAAFGILAGKRKTRGWYIVYMVMSIISACLTLGLLLQSIAGLTDPGHRYWVYDCNYNSYYGHYTGCFRPDLKLPSKRALHGLLLICALLEAGLFIWASAICCRVVCCRTAHMGQVIGPNAVYHAGTHMAQPGQQVMMVQQTQPTVVFATIPPNTQQFVTVPPSQPMAPPAYPQAAYATQGMQYPSQGMQYPAQGMQYPTQGTQQQPSSEETKQAL